MANTEWQQVMPGYRQRWQEQHGKSGDTWDMDEPAYQYGWEARNDSRYRGRQWADVEPDLRRDWETRHRDVPWTKASRGIREAWDSDSQQVGQRRGAGTDERTLQLREEELRANKQSVEAGAVRLRKEVVSEQRTVEVPVTREEVYIERQAVDHRPADRPIGESGETLRVPVRHEEVSVEKRAVVTEEIEIGKRAVQETEHVSGTVRREELRVEREGDVEIEGESGQRRTERRDERPR